MATDSDGGEHTTLPPDEAFKVLGNETRIRILQALGEATDPLSFTELRRTVGIDQGRQFNYHLDKVVGHFVQKSDDGYELRHPGERVVEAVLSGAVTDVPVIERTTIDHACELCDAPIEMRLEEERLDTYCTECPGLRSKEDPTGDGHLSGYFLPPAGVKGRTPEELFEAAWTWTHLELLSLSSDICPRCSATVDVGMSVCEDHETGASLCDECTNRYAMRLHFRCPNCIFSVTGTAPVYLISHTRLLDFLTSHGRNPVSPRDPAAVQHVVSTYDEEIVSRDPFEARLTFFIDGTSLTMTVDEDLSVVTTTGGEPLRTA